MGTVNQDEITDEELFNAAMWHHIRTFNEDAREKGIKMEAVLVGNDQLAVLDHGIEVKRWLAFLNPSEDPNAPAILFTQVSGEVEP